jgi:hypothetical protein
MKDGCSQLIIIPLKSFRLECNIIFSETSVTNGTDMLDQIKNILDSGNSYQH